MGEIEFEIHLNLFAKRKHREETCSRLQSILKTRVTTTQALAQGEKVCAEQRDVWMILFQTHKYLLASNCKRNAWGILFALQRNNTKAIYFLLMNMPFYWIFRWFI